MEDFKAYTYRRSVGKRIEDIEKSELVLYYANYNHEINKASMELDRLAREAASMVIRTMEEQ